MVIIGSDGEPKKIEGTIEDLSRDAANLLSVIYDYIEERLSEEDNDKVTMMVDVLLEATLKTVIDLSGSEAITEGVIRACKTIGESSGLEMRKGYVIREGGAIS